MDMCHRNILMSRQNRISVSRDVAGLNAQSDAYRLVIRTFLSWSLFLHHE
jgi:hypothetical protein